VEYASRHSSPFFLYELATLSVEVPLAAFFEIGIKTFARKVEYSDDVNGSAHDIFEHPFGALGKTTK